MSRYVHIFLGSPGVDRQQILADTEDATGLHLEWVPEPGFYEGRDTTRLLRVHTDGNIYEDEPHLPSFAEHPVQMTFHTAEKTLESERRFLAETYGALRRTGRYSLFATEGIATRIDPT